MDTPLPDIIECKQPHSKNVREILDWWEAFGLSCAQLDTPEGRPLFRELIIKIQDLTTVEKSQMIHWFADKGCFCTDDNK